MRPEVVHRDAADRILVGKRDVMEHTSPQERFGKISLRVARDHHDGTIRVVGANQDIAAFRNAKVEMFELIQQIVRKVPRCLVDLVDQDDRTARLSQVNVTLREPDAILCAAASPE